MPILIKPNLSCNLNCKYCYQHKIKDRQEYDIEKIIITVEKEYSKSNQQIILHGGEILAIGHKDVECLLSLSEKLSKKSSIQTNGTLIDSKYIDLFRKYKTSVGISIDGDGELNDLRCDPATTQKIMDNINILIQNKIPTSVIITIHTHNAGTDEQLHQLKAFILRLNEMKICGRVNINHSKYSLNDNRIKEVFLLLGRFMLETGLALKWGTFSDTIHSLQNDSQCVCGFKECDIYNTMAANVVLGDGSLTNCLRTDIMVRHPQEFKTRTEILSQLDQKDGGCKECEYFEFCKGGCPSNAPDWRVRDSYCSMYYTLLDYYSKTLTQFGIFKHKKEVSCTGIPNDTRNAKHDSKTHTDGIEHIDGEVRHLDG